jgi:phosphoglycerate dehydrogenase-like enzyme
MTNLPVPSSPTSNHHSAFIVISDFPFDPPDRERVAAALMPGQLVVVNGRDELPRALRAMPMAQVCCSFQPPRELRQLAPGVRWVQLPSAGADAAIEAGLLEPSDVLIVTTANGIHAFPMAEYVFSSMLMHVRHWPVLLTLQREHEWPGREQWAKLRGSELHGATLGIVGLGHIGRQVAALGRAFGMQTLGLRRSPSPSEPVGTVDLLFGPTGLGDLLASSDFVVIAVPRTPATRHLIGESELRGMRPHAYLVNIARGEVVDEAALVRALTEGWIGGAGLDVTEHEPLEATSPLWALANVILSPHISGATGQYSARFTELFLDNLERYRTGQPLRNQVDPALGY